MSQGKVLNRSALVAAATALTAVGFVTVPAPAQAVPNIPLAPACTSYLWPGGGLFNVTAGNGTTTNMSTSNDYVVGRPIYRPTSNLGAEATSGTGSGGITGGTSINITINWDQGPGAGHSWNFVGKINDEGLASGVLHATNRDDAWSSSQKFSCIAQAAPPPPPPPPPPKPCPPGSVKPEVPATENCAPPTDAVRMEIGGGALQRTVTVTNNGPLGGTCAYDAKATSGLFAPGLNRQINVGPNGSTSIDVPAPPLGSTYHVTLKCTGTYDGKQVQFGQAEQDVSSF